MQAAIPAHRSRNRQTAFSLALLSAMLVAASAGAAEITVKNDSIPAGTALPTFIAGERVAAWLTAPTTGTIVGVQVVWGSQFNANPSSTEMAIRVSAAGSFPTPGATLATVSGPTLFDGMVNEFRYLTPPSTSMPLSVPVTAGQTFVVDLEFLNTNYLMPTASSIEIDGAIQTGKNSVYASSTWTDAQNLGVLGDFGIRAIIQPVPEPASGLLLLVGLLTLGVARCRMRRPRR